MNSRCLNLIPVVPRPCRRDNLLLHFSSAILLFLQRKLFVDVGSRPHPHLVRSTPSLIKCYKITCIHLNNGNSFPLLPLLTSKILLIRVDDDRHYFFSLSLSYSLFLPPPSPSSSTPPPSLSTVQVDRGSGPPAATSTLTTIHTW